MKGLMPFFVSLWIIYIPLEIIMIDPLISYKSGTSLNTKYPNMAPDINWVYCIGANILDSKNFDAMVRQFPPNPQTIPHNNRIRVSFRLITTWLLMERIPLIIVADKKA